MRKTTVAVVQNPDTLPVERKVLAQSIVDISKAAAKLAASGLNRKAIVLLVSHSAGVSQASVRAVLDSLEALERDYTR